MINGITVGDPAGVGPEIVLKALKRAGEYQAQYVVYGPTKIMKYYNKKFDLGFKFREIETPEEYEDGFVNMINCKDMSMDDFEVGQLSAECGDAAYQYLVRAIHDAMDDKIGAVVTAPLNKEAMHMGGHMFDGHTEVLATETGTEKYAMMFMGPVKIVHVSTHVSLKEAINRVKKERVLTCIEFADDIIKKSGIDHPSVAVAGLNPHASENGLFGDEEAKEIVPAIEAAKAKGINAIGPLSPDSIFAKNLKGVYDVTIAMYHDQGHIAAKMGNVDKCVNCTLGLPIIRTSVDHGTAFDIAGKGIASEENMLESMKCAEVFQSRS